MVITIVNCCQRQRAFPSEPDFMWQCADGVHSSARFTALHKDRTEEHETGIP